MRNSSGLDLFIGKAPMKNFGQTGAPQENPKRVSGRTLKFSIK